MRDMTLRFHGVWPAIALTWNEYEVHFSIENEKSQESLSLWLALKNFDRFNSKASYSFVIQIDRVIPSIERRFTTFRWHRFVFWHGDSDGNPPLLRRETRIEMPCWFFVLALSIYPGAAFLRGPARRWHRRRHGRCVRCAYDLTGLPEPRCPECGEAFGRVAQVAGTGGLIPFERPPPDVVGSVPGHSLAWARTAIRGRFWPGTRRVISSLPSRRRRVL